MKKGRSDINRWSSFPNLQGWCRHLCRCSSPTQNGHPAGRRCQIAFRTSQMPQGVTAGWVTLNSLGAQRRAMTSHHRTVPPIHGSCVRGDPRHIHRDRGRPPFLLPATTGKGGFKFSHRLQAQEVLGKAQTHKGQKFGHRGRALEPSFSFKTCLRNPGPSASAWAVTDASDAAVVPKLKGESHAKQSLQY